MRRFALAAAQILAIALTLPVLLATTLACRTRDFDRSYDASGDCGPGGVVTIRARSCSLELSGVDWLPADGRAYRPSFDGDGFSAGGPASLTPPLHLADGTPFTPPGGETGPFPTTLDCRGVPAGTVPPSFALSCASPDGPVCDAVLTQRP
jgi:hypothetical protein